MASEQAMLLPVPYFHVVFTLPHALNPLIRVNQRLLYAMLFRIAATTLRTFALDPCHLGAEPAITMVLHTWGQTLEEHNHVHCVISGGGLSLDARHWVDLPKRKRRRPFLFHVKALSKVFRGKFIAALKRAQRAKLLKYIGQSAELEHPAAWKTLLDDLWKQDWVVYCKPPFGGPEQVLKYLSRYTHRVAISNQRILSFENNRVCFAYRDYADGNKHKQMSVPVTEFLRRFLLHVVPTGFMRIRHYGITANCRRANKLARCREILAQPDTAVTATETLPVTESSLTASQDAAPRCPACGGVMRVIEILGPIPCRRDTS
jgi:hypothetical protein